MKTKNAPKTTGKVEFRLLLTGALFASAAMGALAPAPRGQHIFPRFGPRRSRPRPGSSTAWRRRRRSTIPA
jgi:hypothetical protein